MKKLLAFLCVALVAITACKKFDDSDLWEAIRQNEDRISRLEEMCSKMNTNIESLQTIVQALQNNDAIKSVSSLSSGEGYVITFTSGKSITIYNGSDGADGKDGIDGKDGSDGKDGADAKAPVISVRLYDDGEYYWTIDGEWLIVDGKMIKASGADGMDGSDGNDGSDGQDGVDGKDGADGVTPTLKIEEGYWYISYDEGKTWTQLGKAATSNGLTDVSGNNVFAGVSVENGYVTFILNDSSATTIRIPYQSVARLEINLEQHGTLKDVLTAEQKRTTVELKLSGYVDSDDVKTLFRMQNLDVLDMRDAFSVSKNAGELITTLDFEPYGDIWLNKTIRVLLLPKNTENSNCRYLSNLEYVVVSDSLSAGSYYYITVGHKCQEVRSIIVAEGPTYVRCDAAKDVETLVLPSTTEKVSNTVYKQSGSYVCKAIEPPTVSSGSYDFCASILLYVPTESIEKYKSAKGWKKFNEILSIDEYPYPEYLKY